MTVEVPKHSEAEFKTLSHFKATDPLRFNFAVALVVFLTYFFTTSRLEENLQAIGLAALLAGVVFFEKLATSWKLWAVVTAMLTGGILLRPTDVPNHHYMLAYTSLTFAFCLSAPTGRRMELLQHNFRWILVALMGIATLQRLFQPNFMSGEYLGMEIALGGFLYPILKMFPGTMEVIVENREQVDLLRNTSPAQLNLVSLESPFPALPDISKVFMVTILAIEAWICFLMWKCPKHWLTHLSMIAFGLTLSLLRQELTFISVLCLLALFTVDRNRVFLRRTYAVLVILIAAAVIKTVNLPSHL